MTRNLPVQAASAPRVIHYVQPASPTDASLLLYTAVELATRRQEQQLLYARWLARRQVQVEKDRKARRFWLGFGAVAGLGLLALLVLLGWLAYQAITGVIAGAGVGLLGVLAAVLLLGLIGIGGHRCITTIQHWH